MCCQTCAVAFTALQSSTMLWRGGYYALREPSVNTTLWKEEGHGLDIIKMEKYETTSLVIR